MFSKADLKIDFCERRAAEYAVTRWHYSRKMPVGKLTTFGVWEQGKYVGCVVFGRGANNNIGSAYGLDQTGVCELVRVAMTGHASPVSRIVSIAVKMLSKFSPGIRLIVSYADPAQDHHGGIYQAMNWTYAGSSRPQRAIHVAGGFMHKRVASARWGTASPKMIKEMTGLKVEYGPVEWKHTYLLPMDSAMREQVNLLAKKYPKRAGSIVADATVHQTVEGGSLPTPALSEATIPQEAEA